MNFQPDLLFSYIDPGTGSLLLQMIVAGVLGVIAFFRNTIFGFFGLSKRNKPSVKEVLPAQPSETSDAK